MMNSLPREQRKQLERTVREARRVAENGARQALGRLGVPGSEAPPELTPGDRALRNRLRAHGRQLGDVLDQRSGAQAITRLVAECAYESWHRMLFARFLAENELLIEPSTDNPISLADCRELAAEQRCDWIELASGFAVRMLPQIFRAGDPVLDVSLPPEKRQELECLLESLDPAVFTSDDSLGWVYQFWQADAKDAINASEVKIGADQLPAVTQLFTGDYMVLFLLHNSLGAWWAGKILDRNPDLARTAESEEELRHACSVPSVEWEYLRFVRSDGVWEPAAGKFSAWPASAREITVLDPCMGSGHFLAFALSILGALRAHEERTDLASGFEAALRDNLYGLELDARCTQIAAFNLALCAWRRGGYRALSGMNVACSGLPVSTRVEEWLALTDREERARETMRKVYSLFQQGPLLGSLIDPRRMMGPLFAADLAFVQDLVERALDHETQDDVGIEVAVAARGVAASAQLLGRRYHLVITNVPYLARGRQCAPLRDYCERQFPDAKNDIANVFLERCCELAMPGAAGVVHVVMPQNWLFLPRYRKQRERLLISRSWNLLVRLGVGAFETISGEIVNVILLSVTNEKPTPHSVMHGIDASAVPTGLAKSEVLASGPVRERAQFAQLQNPDARVLLDEVDAGQQLAAVAESRTGTRTADNPLFLRCHWELPRLQPTWELEQSSPTNTEHYSARTYVIRWERGDGALEEYRRAGLASIQGREAWGHRGVCLGLIGDLPATIYGGQIFDMNAGVVWAVEHMLPALWAYLSSEEYRKDVRVIDQQLKLTTATLLKVPFNEAQWREVAGSRYPHGLPLPFGDDPTQWLFHGHPFGSVIWDSTAKRTAVGPRRLSADSLQVAVARLLGYRWPTELDDTIQLATEQRDWVNRCRELDTHADEDGIVCLTAVRGEPRAVERLQALLMAAWDGNWTAAQHNALLAAAGFEGRTLDEWLRDGFFEQHCQRFHQRPFIWHIWDGRDDGFSALVNYHKLAAPNGGGRRTLEKLIYAYLGDWIDRQSADQKEGVEGSDARLAAAEHLRNELQRILEGEPPYDVFARWKPLDQQPIGWDPDLDDGVRINIRPFMSARPLKARGKNSSILRFTPKIKWDKDRGKEVEREKREFPWFWGWDQKSIDFEGGREFDGNRWNDLHYSCAAKQTAREQVLALGRRGGSR